MPVQWRGDFFEAQPLSAQKEPDFVTRFRHPAGHQLVLQYVQFHMAHLVEPLDYERPVRLQRRLAVSAHLGESDLTVAR